MRILRKLIRFACRRWVGIGVFITLTGALLAGVVPYVLQTNPYAHAVIVEQERAEKLQAEFLTNCPQLAENSRFRSATAALLRRRDTITERLKSGVSFGAIIDVREVPGISSAVKDSVDEYERELRAMGCLGRTTGK